MRIVKEHASKYHAHEAISKGRLFKMAKSPRYFKYSEDNPEEPSEAMKLGSAFHAYVLEPDMFSEEIAVMPKVDKRTKVGKATYAEFLETATGKIIIDEEQMDTIKHMKKALLAHPLASKLIEGKVEQSVYFTDEATGVECRVRPDITLEKGDKVILSDLKSCVSCEAHNFQRDALKLGYDLQSYMYSYGRQADTFIFIAVEKTAPYLINVLVASQDFLDRGKQIFEDLMGKYSECTENDTWYGMNGSDMRINSLELPYWARKELE
jgi:hypothetical protein